VEIEVEFHEVEFLEVEFLEVEVLEVEVQVVVGVEFHVLVIVVEIEFDDLVIGFVVVVV
ncbi:hypothetical protein A2U01_0088494, partial [Trifolium medium]|nr:hypothetical protein [Trifolium medium]